MLVSVVLVGLLGSALGHGVPSPMLYDLVPDHVKADSCKPGSWGANCMSQCQSDVCIPFPISRVELGIVCDQRTGDVKSCVACKPGRWGASCENTCQFSEHCDHTRVLRCDQTDGLNLQCESCLEGWSGIACETEIACPALEPSHKRLTSSCQFGQALGFNTTCQFSCEAGYSVTDPISIRCLEKEIDSSVGRWTNEVPFCLAKTCDPITIPFAEACSGLTGDICSPQPWDGYTCIGAWECIGQRGEDNSLFVPVDVPPQCFETSKCGACSPSAVCKTVGSESVCICKSGFWGTGKTCTPCTRCSSGFQAAKHCGVSEDGALSSHDTVCRDVDECQRKCAFPGDVDCHKCSQKCFNEPGFYQCGCQDGYHLEADGFTCKAVSCKIHHIHHAVKSCAGVFGEVCDLTQENSCEPGYVGSGRLVCDATGSWEGKAICRALNCGAMSVSNINRDQPCKETSQPWGSRFLLPVTSQCTINCEKGYTSSGAGVIRCEPCGHQSVSFSTDSSCEAESCAPHFVDARLGVRCSGIRTGEQCIGGQHFACPSGYSALGTTTCTADGVFKDDESDPPRCVPSKDSLKQGCLGNPCGEHGQCIPNALSDSFVCQCAFPYIPSADGFRCTERCPPPSTMSPDHSDCVYPPGFQRVVFSKDAHPSAVMVGQADIPREYSPSQLSCKRIPYQHHYVWDEATPVLVQVSVHHPNAEAFNASRVDKFSVSGTIAPLTYWVENTTASYFTACFSELHWSSVSHDTVTINFVAFTHAFGLESGTALISPRGYRNTKGNNNIEKFVGFQQLASPPIVFSSLHFTQSTPERSCNPNHCVCNTGAHNSATVVVNDVYGDAMAVSFRELPRFRKLLAPEVEQTIASRICGTSQCEACPLALRRNCSLATWEVNDEFSDAMCFHGKDANVQWLALPNAMHTSTLIASTTSIPYVRLSLDQFLFKANCFDIVFPERLTNPVVFASLNHRTGALHGPLALAYPTATASYIESVGTTGFRFCYKSVVEAYEDQPRSQPVFANVDWMVFHTPTAQ